MSEIAPRDETILDLPDGYDYVQIVLSRMEGNMLGGLERSTYVSSHMLIDAVRKYLESRRTPDV